MQFHLGATALLMSPTSKGCSKAPEPRCSTANLIQACHCLAGAFRLSSIVLNLRQPLQDLIVAYSPTFTGVPGPGGHYLAPEEAGYSPLRLNSCGEPQKGLCQVGAVWPTTVPSV